jgi:hypothetical protein
MDIQSIVAQLKEELSKIEHALEALVGVGSQPARRGRPPKGSSAPSGKKRILSASARAKISAAQKARWAKQKKASHGVKQSAPSAKEAAPKRKPMSPAAKKKLSALMKARWAAKKKAPQGA